LLVLVAAALVGGTPEPAPDDTPAPLQAVQAVPPEPPVHAFAAPVPVTAAAPVATPAPASAQPAERAPEAVQRPKPRSRPAAVPAKASPTPRVQAPQPAMHRPPPHRPRLAQRNPPDLACPQELAIARELCKAVRCTQSEFSRHPVCLRLQADRRALDAQRELLGGS
jgi:hypothetical protein